MWRVESISNEPNARCAHQSENIGGKLYLFGGWNDDNQMLNDLNILDVDTMKWEEIIVNTNHGNNFITPRNGHSLNSYNGKLIVFGGGSFSGFLNDIFIFDPIKIEWECINTTGDIPSGRSKHSSTLMGDKLYIFGGGDGIRLYNDMYSLDLITFEWVKIQESTEQTGANSSSSLTSSSSTKIQITSTTTTTTTTTTQLIQQQSGNDNVIPSARWGHTMVNLGDGKHLALFAGHAGTKRINDLHLFNIETGKWKHQIEFSPDSDDIPLPRAGHSCTMIGPHMVIFGGGDGHIINDVYGLDTRVWKWWKIRANNTPADARCAHSATIVKNKLFIYGGGNGVQCLKRLLIMDNLDQFENLYKNRHLIKSIPKQNITNEETSLTTVNINNNNNNNNNKNNNNNNNSKVNRNLDHLKNSISANIQLKSKNIENNNHTVLPQFPSYKSISSSGVGRINIENIKKELIDKFKDSYLTELQKKDIVYFLNNIGLSKYVNKFIEEEIDSTVFHLLTEDHLKQIGIKSLGERLSILKGIREI